MAIEAVKKRTVLFRCISVDMKRAVIIVQIDIEATLGCLRGDTYYIVRGKRYGIISVLFISEALDGLYKVHYTFLPHGEITAPVRITRIPTGYMVTSEMCNCGGHGYYRDPKT